MRCPYLCKPTIQMPRDYPSLPHSRPRCPAHQIPHLLTPQYVDSVTIFPCHFHSHTLLLHLLLCLKSPILLSCHFHSPCDHFPSNSTCMHTLMSKHHIMFISTPHQHTTRSLPNQLVTRPFLQVMHCPFANPFTVQHLMLIIFQHPSVLLLSMSQPSFPTRTKCNLTGLSIPPTSTTSTCISIPCHIILSNSHIHSPSFANTFDYSQDSS